MVTNIVKVWMESNENCGRNSTLQIIAAYVPVLRKISKCHNFCNFWQIAKKVTACIIMIHFIKLGESDENLERSRVFKNCKMKPNDPKPNSRIHASKVPTICALRSQIFLRFALRLGVFEILHILGFPIDFHGKISK